jgi:hypothetical protein
MAAARNREIDCVLVWKFDRFARSTRHLLAALEEFNHLGVRFVGVQDQIDTDSPMGRAMFTIIGAMAELESSLISERVTAGMRAAQTRGKHLGRPPIPRRVISEIETLATSTDLSIRQIQGKIAGRAGRGRLVRLIERAAKHAPEPMTRHGRLLLLSGITVAINWVHRMCRMGCHVDDVSELVKIGHAVVTHQIYVSETLHLISAQRS